MTSFSPAEIEDLTQRFEVFEALHHPMQICNPMSEADLDAVVHHLAVTASPGRSADGPGPQVIDIACGYGELLLRLVNQAPTLNGVGVDLSPWMLRSAAAAANQRHPSAALAWHLSEASKLEDTLTQRSWDVAACLGATWIWHGLNGTIRAMASLVRPGGRVAIGDMRTRDGVTADDVPDQYGQVMALAQQEALFADHGLQIVDRIDTSDESWDAYIERTREAATAWGDPEFIAVQREWEADHERDRSLLTWSVWIADRDE